MPDSPEVLINGHPDTGYPDAGASGTQPSDARHAAHRGLSALDRGLAYGDGLFETMAVVEGEPVLWDAHLARLTAGCARLGIPAPDPQQLAGEAARLCHGHPRAVLKLVYTRGSGGRGYAPPAPAAPVRILSVHPWPTVSGHAGREGVRVRVCQTRLARQPALAGMKHLNRLEQVLARQEWNDPDIAEGVMCDTHGQVIEGVMSNLFVVKDGQLWTPDLSECGVAGIMRAYLLARCSSRGVSATIAPMSLASLHDADEVLLCNSVIGIWPVRELLSPAAVPHTTPDQYPANDHRITWPVGPVTQSLRAWVEEELRI